MIKYPRRPHGKCDSPSVSLDEDNWIGGGELTGVLDCLLGNSGVDKSGCGELALNGDVGVLDCLLGVVEKNGLGEETAGGVNSNADWSDVDELG